MRPMRNPVNIMRQMARQTPEWRQDPRWVKAIRSMRKLARKFKKERVARRISREEAKAVVERSLA